MTPRRGLLIPAYQWSTAMIFVSAFLWVAVGVTDVALYSQQSELLTRPLHSLIMCALTTLTLGSLVVRLAAVIVTGQRRILARLDAMDADADAIVAAYAATLAATTVIPMPSKSPLRVR